MGDKFLGGCLIWAIGHVMRWSTRTRWALIVGMITLTACRIQAQVESFSIGRSDLFMASKPGMPAMQIAGMAVSDADAFTLRYGYEGPQATALSYGRILGDTYRSQWTVMPAVGFVIHGVSGPAASLLIARESLNHDMVAALSNEYVWGVAGTKNFARQRFDVMEDLGGLYIGAFSEAIWRPRSQSSMLDHLTLGPVVKYKLGISPFCAAAWAVSDAKQRYRTQLFIGPTLCTFEH